MTVQEIIDELIKIEDKTLPVYGFSIREGERYRIDFVDTSIDGIVDINIQDEI